MTCSGAPANGIATSTTAASNPPRSVPETIQPMCPWCRFGAPASVSSISAVGRELEGSPRPSVLARALDNLALFGKRDYWRSRPMLRAR